MNIDPQRKTWSNFIKLTTYTLITVVAIIVLIAFFLL